MEPVQRGGLGRGLLFMFASFALAFCVQLAVHESGHLLAGLLAGAGRASMTLHPFYTAQVVFQTDPPLAAQVFIGLAGPGLDLLLALTVGVLFWRSRSVWTFSALTWAALALFGEGLGMVGSIAVYANSSGGVFYEDTTQLLRVGVPIGALWAVAIALTLAGTVFMALIAPAGGLSDSRGPRGLLARLAGFAVYIPAYFLAAVGWILAFSPARDNLEVRGQQLLMGLVTAGLLALLYRPIRAVFGRLLRPRERAEPSWRALAIVGTAAAAAFVALLLVPVVRVG